MAEYVLLRFENNEDAQTLIDDMAGYPASPILTPTLEHTVYATVVKTLSESDPNATED